MKTVDLRCQPSGSARIVVSVWRWLRAWSETSQADRRESGWLDVKLANDKKDAVVPIFLSKRASKYTPQ